MAGIGGLWVAVFLWRLKGGPWSRSMIPTWPAALEHQGAALIMADMRPQGEPRPDLEAPAGHEDSDVSVGGIFMFALGLVALGMVIHVVLGWSCEVSPGGNREARRCVRRSSPMDVVPPHPAPGQSRRGPDPVQASRSSIG